MQSNKLSSLHALTKLTGSQTTCVICSWLRPSRSYEVDAARAFSVRDSRSICLTLRVGEAVRAQQRLVWTEKFGAITVSCSGVSVCAMAAKLLQTPF